MAQRMSDRYAKDGNEMMDILVQDIFRYEELSEKQQEELGLLAEEATFQIPDINEECWNNIDVKPVNDVDDVNINSNVSGDQPGFTNTRFPQVTSNDTDKFLENSANKNTKYKTKSDLKIFVDWANSAGEFRNIENIPEEELDGLLARFFMSARKKNGEDYEPDSLSSIQNSLDRHLKDAHIKFSIKHDSTFQHSRRVLEAKRKSLKAQGKGNKCMKAEPLTHGEITILYERDILGSANPEALLNTVWLNNGTFFGLRGRQDHVNLLWGDVTLKQTSDGKDYLEFTERSTKTRSGARKGDFRKVTPKLFQEPSNPSCPVKMYKLYKSRRPPDMNTPDARFYLRPLVNPTSDCWYSHQPIGKDKLGKMMSLMANKGSLSGRKVNHSTRKTFATSLVQAGLPPTEIAHLGGWKNIQSINEYSVRSLQQQESASNIVSNVLLPDVNKENLGDGQLSSLKSCTTSSVLEQNFGTGGCEVPFSLFNGAHFSGSTININFVQPSKRLKSSSTSQSVTTQCTHGQGSQPDSD